MTSANVNNSSKDNTKKLANFIIFIVLILIIVLIYYFIQWFFKSTDATNYLLSNMHNTKTLYTITSNKAPISSNGVQMTYSMWIYINNWDYNYSTPKHVFHRGDKILKYANPNVWLYPNENKLMVRFEVKKPLQNMQNELVYSPKKNNPKYNPEILNENFVCDLPYVPIQKWMNLTICLNNNVSDIYIDGKLIRSCILNGIPHIKYVDNEDNNIYLGGDNYNNPDMPGFDGYMSNVIFLNKNITSVEAEQIYNNGPVKPLSLYQKVSVYFSKMFNSIYKCKSYDTKSTNKILDNTITIKSGSDIHTYNIST